MASWKWIVNRSFMLLLFKCIVLLSENTSFAVPPVWTTAKRLQWELLDTCFYYFGLLILICFSCALSWVGVRWGGRAGIVCSCELLLMLGPAESAFVCTVILASAKSAEEQELLSLLLLMPIAAFILWKVVVHSLSMLLIDWTLKLPKVSLRCQKSTWLVIDNNLDDFVISEVLLVLRLLILLSMLLTERKLLLLLWRDLKLLALLLLLLLWLGTVMPKRPPLLFCTISPDRL